MLNFNQSKQMIILGIFALLALLGVFLVSLRSPGEWVCNDDGLWVAEGKPKDPRPGLYCK